MDLILPVNPLQSDLVDILRREGEFNPLIDVPSLTECTETFLKTLFIVSNTRISNEGSLEAASHEWMYSENMPVTGAYIYLCY